MQSMRVVAAAVVIALFIASCSPLVRDVSVLSSDAMQGRDNATVGSIARARTT